MHKQRPILEAVVFFTWALQACSYSSKSNRSQLIHVISVVASAISRLPTPSVDSRLATDGQKKAKRGKKTFSSPLLGLLQNIVCTPKMVLFTDQNSINREMESGHHPVRTMVLSFLQRVPLDHIP
jgi:hypothetical protein